MLKSSDFFSAYTEEFMQKMCDFCYSDNFSESPIAFTKIIDICSPIQHFLNVNIK